MSDLNQTEVHLEKIVNLLRSKMKEGGFTQVAVQKELGWKSSYISQIFSSTKSLRVDQMLQILAVIGLDPADFFREIFEPSSQDLETRRQLIRQVRDGLQASCALCDWLDEGGRS